MAGTASKPVGQPLKPVDFLIPAYRPSVPAGRTHSLRLRLAALAALALVLVAALGLWPSRTFVARLTGESSSALTPAADRFPCESDGCGCQTAAHCWPDCCCFSRTQRLAWAIDHHVQPPASVRFTDDEWRAALELSRAQHNQTNANTDAPRSSWPLGVSSFACQKLGLLVTLAVVTLLLTPALLLAPRATGTLSIPVHSPAASPCAAPEPPIPRRS